MITKKRLVEGYKYDSLIRDIVRDVIKIFKREDEGEFYLPEDSEDEFADYKFKDVSVDVELILEQTNSIDDFLLNADYYGEDDVIVIKILYNPNNKMKLTYSLIGELNELISHEVRHNYQKNKNMFNTLKGDDEESVEDEEETGYEYYSQPHELDAQYYGFKRMSKITKKPFEYLVREWFKKNKDIHQMDNNDSEKIIQKILTFTP